jgi:hypothetical protein
MANLFITDYGEVTVDDFRNKTDGEIKELLLSYYCRLKQSDLTFANPDSQGEHLDNMVSFFKLYNIGVKETLDFNNMFVCYKIRELLEDFKRKYISKSIGSAGGDKWYYWSCLLKITSFTNPYVYQPEYIYDNVRRFIDRNLSNSKNIIVMFDNYYNETIVPYLSKQKDNRFIPYDMTIKKIAYDVHRNWCTDMWEWIDEKGNRICSAEDGETLPLDVKLIRAPKYAPIYKVGDYSPSESTPCYEGWQLF